MADPSAARQVDVPLRRLRRWLEGFEARHGPWDAVRSDDPPGWHVVATDGSTALVHEPRWLPLVQAATPGGTPERDVELGDRHPGTTPSGGLAELASQRPTFGVLLIRRAGYAVAAFAGSDLVERKVGSRHIHGRTAAGGWSQQRYARRRANQADEVVEAAALAANRILGRGRDAGRTAPAFLVTGGDRPLLAAVTDLLDPVVAALPVVVHLGVGTPDAEVVLGVPDRVLAVRIGITEP